MSSIKINVLSPDKDWSATFQQNEIWVGRGGDRPVDIKIPDPTVSRCHCRIWLAPDGYWFEDNNSTHGSKKSESLLMGPIRIFSGDQIKIGESVLSIEQADITESDLDLGGLFDVHIQDRLNLQAPPPTEQVPGAKIRVIGQQPVAKSTKVKAKKSTHADAEFMGRLANIFGFEELHDALFLSIEDIVAIFGNNHRGCILLVDSQTNELVVRSHYPLYEPAVSTTLARQTMTTQQAFIWEADHSEISSASLKRLNIRCGMYAPLTFGSQSIGMISVDSTSIRAEFTQEDLCLFSSITQVLGGLITAKQKRGA